MRAVVGLSSTSSFDHVADFDLSMILSGKQRKTIDKTLFKCHNVHREIGGAVMDAVDYEPLDVNALQEKKSVVISSKQAIKDVIPIKWDDKVAAGYEKVLLVADGGT